MTQTLHAPTKSAAILAHFLSPNDGRIEKIRALLSQKGFSVDVLSWEGTNGPYPTLTGGRLLAWSSHVPLLAVLIWPLAFVRHPTTLASKKAAKDAASAFEKRRVMRIALAQNKYDLVIATDPETLEVAAKSKSSCGFSLLYDAHEYYPEEVPDNQMRKDWVFRTHSRAAPSLDAFVTVNAEIAALYHQTEPYLPQAHVVHNAAPAHLNPPIDDGRLRRAAGLGSEYRICLYQGGLLPDRGLETLVEAFKLIDDPWRLICMGSGPREAHLRALAGGKTIFLPPVAWSDLAHWTAGADLGAILYAPTCANQRLCSPNKLWELPTAGVPILATDLPFVGRMVNTHHLGFTIPASSSALDIAKAITDISSDALKHTKVSCRAFTETHNWNTEAATVASIIDTIMARR
jgi:glycosyltransferase involved in cell wall biosynthesis